MSRKRNINVFILLAALLIIASCAQQGAPIGGPEDLDPPIVLEAKPPNYSSNYEADKILITFDEYLDMGNFTQELIVSPPMEEQPIVKLRNKTLIIEFEEELKEDVTYTFNFGQGIKDLNEGNELLNFEYVFATGDELDSLSIKGKLRNAEDLSIPEAPIFVMLYNELYDSIPLLEIPYYVGRTDKKGNFAVNNLRKGSYKLFVLKDANNNFLFDLPTESIAYLDSSILVDGDYFRSFLLESGVYDSSDLIVDTTSFNIDTTGMSPDTIAMYQDSIAMYQDSLAKKVPDFNTIFVDLFMFTEEDQNQYISEYTRKEREFFSIEFNLPLSDSFNYWPIYPPELGEENLIEDMGQNRDTLIVWLSDTIAASYDTIGLVLSYTKLDTLEEAFLKQDTLMFTFKEKETKNKPGKEEPNKAKPILKVNTIKKNGKQALHKDLEFRLDEPLKAFDPSLFELYIIPDSIEIKEEIIPQADSAYLGRIRVKKKWKEEGKYRLVMYPGAITNVFEVTNDTIDRIFNIKPITDYARINLNLENVTDTLLVQLFKKEKMVRQLDVSTSGLYVLENLLPDTYRIKIIHDRNGNGKWDTGKYLDGLQPEKVEFLPTDLKVRANWDHDITYSIGSNSELPKSGSEKREEEDAPLFR